MGRLMISSSQMCISREQEEFLSAYRTDEAWQSFIDSYGKEKVNFLDGGYGANSSENGYPNIPYLYDYEVEYLEMSDVERFCYLDLGLVLDDNVYDVYGEFTLLGYPNNNAYAGWFGCWNVAPDYSIAVNRQFTNPNSAVALIAASTQDRGRVFPTTNNTKYDILLKSDGYVYINGEYLSKSDLAHTKGGMNTFKVFRNDNAISSYVNYTFGRIHCIKIWKEDILIHDYIPVVKDGIGYMYDKFGSKLFAAQGGGSFVVGPRI